MFDRDVLKLYASWIGFVMQIKMRSAVAVRRASELYDGDSKPLSRCKDTDRPLDLDWWKSHPQKESAESGRHLAGMRLYLELAEASKHPLGEWSFPARFDFEDGVVMRPDKGVMKVLLDEALVVDRMMGAQLVLDLTPAGRAWLDGRA